MGKDIHVVPSDDKWAVKKEAAEKAGSLHDTQKEAIDVGRERAKKEGGELVIHDRKGKIRDKDSYGPDPFPPRDTKH